MLHSARMAAGDDTVMGELPEPDSVATYGVGEDQVRVLLRCEISTLLTAALGPAVRKHFRQGSGPTLMQVCALGHILNSPERRVRFFCYAQVILFRVFTQPGSRAAVPHGSAPAHYFRSTSVTGINAYSHGLSRWCH